MRLYDLPRRVTENCIAGRRAHLRFSARAADCNLPMTGDAFQGRNMNLCTRLTGACAVTLLMAACADSEPVGDLVPTQWVELKAGLEQALPADATGYVFGLIDGDRIAVRTAGGDLRIDSIVPIASATKAPSAAAILTLVDAGQLDLDRPVADYLGDVVDWPALKQPITMRMLLNHTSGLAPEPGCLDENVTTTLVECVQQIADAPLRFTPGRQFQYGGGSYQVAGLVAERISGKPWERFFATALGEPLGLRDYHFLGDANPRIAGGAVSSLDDYLRILQMFMSDGVHGGRRLLSEEMVALIRSDQIAGLPKRGTPLDRDLYPGYAFGWWFSDPALHPGSPGPEFSDPGALGTVPWIDLGRDYGAVVLLVDGPQAGLDLWNTLRPLILRGLDEAPA